MYIAIVVITIMIVFTILILSVVTTSKAYTYKHTVDPVEPSEKPAEKAAAEAKTAEAPRQHRTD